MSSCIGTPFIMESQTQSRDVPLFMGNLAPDLYVCSRPWGPGRGTDTHFANNSPKFCAISRSPFAPPSGHAGYYPHPHSDLARSRSLRIGEIFTEVVIEASYWSRQYNIHTYTFINKDPESLERYNGQPKKSTNIEASSIVGRPITAFYFWYWNR